MVRGAAEWRQGGVNIAPRLHKRLQCEENNCANTFTIKIKRVILRGKKMSMGEDEYKYLVNPFNIVDIVDSDVHRSHGPNDPDTVTIFFSRNNLRELNTFSSMVLDDDILFTLPGYEILFNIIDHSNPDLPVYSIILEATDIDVSSAKSLREICSCDEYDALRGSYDGTKITVERNDDDSVTFSVPTLQGLRIREDAVPVFVSHGDEPGERGEQGYMNNEAVRFFSDVIGPFTSDSWQSPHSAIVKSLKTEKAIKFVDSWFAKKPPRKSLFILKEGSNDIFILTNVSIEAEEYGVIIFEFSYYGNIMGPDVSIPTAVGKRGSLPFQSGMLTYKREDAMPKGITDVELRPNVEIYAKVNGKDEVEKLRKCLTDGYWGSIQEHWNNYWNLDIHKPCYDGFMKPIGGNEKVQSPQLHRARLNKPKDI